MDNPIKMKLGTLCYIEHDGKILLLKRNKKENDVHEGKWIGLGGKIEQGESPVECIIREVEEESGLKILDPKLRGILTFPKFKDNIDWYVFLYTATEFSGELIDSPEGHLEWIEKDKVLEMPTWEGDLIFLNLLLKDQSNFEIKFEYNTEGKLDSYTIY
ncbi:NUDIX hydrolase [Oceanirhabdus sp. W0125-5]|uniref:NUDIX hydrolase n=1 Tax=Oceanirhabdus sp. W0125-5 TaxID=2999116 RepID=UPI0022F2B3A8|nr:8-oxo-dGTP diphosphatase [Oceanirhabdus sp. W0125-5]WBW99645.1 8-oxo-dGTP diphosphatase [Oceanirhabdus sp. W0125-5]